MMDKLHCKGCEDDFYNNRATPGFDGAVECWSLKTAYLTLRKRVHIDQRPPWNQAPEIFPTCYRVKQYVFVDGDKHE